VRVVIAAGALLVVGCAMPTSRPTIPYTPIEQLLISEAIARGMTDLSLDLSATGSSLYLDKTGLTADHPFMADVVEGWLGRLGFHIESNPQDSDFTVRLIVQSIGTSQKIRLFGMPASNSTLLPISLPELAIYKRNREEGYTRFYFDIFDTKSGEYVRSTRDFEGSVSHTRFTILFVFRFTRSDLPGPISRGEIELTDD
jgi:hypothetical protein